MKKRILLVFTLIFILLAFTACGKYTAHYSAVSYAHSNTDSSAFMSFWRFEGTEIFEMKCGRKGAELAYSGKLETGSLTVYCDCGGGKQELFSLGAGDEIESAVSLSEGKVTVIVETDGLCETGELEFDIVG